MTYAKLTPNLLLGKTLATGLIISSAITPVLAVETTPVGFADVPTAVSEKTWLGRSVATSVGALSGLTVYSLVTGDWGWIMWVPGIAAPTAATATTPVVAASAAATTAVPVAAAATVAADVAAAATTAAPTAAAAVSTPPATAAAVTISTTSLIANATAWANRWMGATASGLTGAILGNTIYSYK